MADETAPSARTVLGRSKIFTPEVINDIHMKSELGRYRMRGFSMFKKIPHWDELIFLPGTLTRFVIEGYREKCVTKTVLGARFAKKPIELDIPIYITGMSFGALSIEAKMALAKGASMAGTATCSGEGGMIPPERVGGGLVGHGGLLEDELALARLEAVVVVELLPTYELGELRG